MKKYLLRIPFAVVLGLTCGITAHAQKPSTTEKAVAIAVIVVGKTARFSTKTIQAAAPVVLGATEKTAVLSVKAAGFVVKRMLPSARKLIVVYLKAKLPL